MGCKICKSDNTRFLFKAEEIDFNLKGIFDIYKCETCEYIYVNNPPEDLNYYYPSNYDPYKMAIQDEKNPLIRWARTRNIRVKEKIINKYKKNSYPNKVLDVGCSTGIFLDQTRISGWETFGVELNPAAAEYAKNRFNLQVETGQLSDKSWNDTCFDVVTFWDSLEHTLNPRDALEICNKKLNNSGYIIFTIPNFESLDKKIFKKYWIGFDFPRHLSVFPLHTIKTLLECTGFSIVEIGCGVGGYYNFLSTLKRLFLKRNISKGTLKLIIKILYIPGLRYVFDPIFWFLDLLGIGNNRLIVAQKKQEVN